MTDFYHSDAIDFKGNSIKYTNATGPVIIDNNRIFLHKASSTNKFQFIGGRQNDNVSPKQNAINRAYEDLGLKVELIEDKEPFHIIDEIQRDGKKEVLVLTHYLARIKSNSKPNKGEFGWYSLKEILQMEKEDKLSSPNIVLASKHFLNSQS